MRNIKFRAWDTKYKKMIFTGFHLLGEVMAFHGIEQYCMETREEDGSSIARWNDIKIMQFTGLLDKNGKEIYEGDIIKSDGTGQFTGQVSYDLQMAGFLIKWKEIGRKEIHRYAYFNVTSGGEDSFSCDFMEVIGNIYENPELLK